VMPRDVPSVLHHLIYFVHLSCLVDETHLSQCAAHPDHAGIGCVVCSRENRSEA
jgi:hypothetical protein